MSTQNTATKNKDHFPPYDKFKDFKTLDAWQKCRDVKLFFYNIVLPCLPREEKNILGYQIRRAAISITANIAEGYGRYHYQEGIQFYRIAPASIYELKDHLISCYDLDFIAKEQYVKGTRLIESAKRILNGFINFTREKVNSN